MNPIIISSILGQILRFLDSNRCALCIPLYPPVLPVSSVSLKRSMYPCILCILYSLYPPCTLSKLAVSFNMYFFLFCPCIPEIPLLKYPFLICSYMYFFFFAPVSPRSRSRILEYPFLICS